jgi:hypothetical protein
MNDIKSEVKELAEIADRHNELKTSISKFIFTAHNAYYQAERIVSAKYDEYSESIYGFVIPFTHYDDFEIFDTQEGYFSVGFEGEDRDGEKFNWSLSIPYNPDELESDVQKFEEKLIRETEEKIQNKKDKKLENLKKQEKQIQKEIAGLTN